MRSTLLVFLLCGCDELASRKRVEALEMRVKVLEAQQEKQKNNETINAARLEDCLAGAEERYWDIVKLNGHQPDPKSHPERWVAADSTWKMADDAKRGEIERCRITYGKN